VFIPNAGNKDEVFGGWECPKDGRYGLVEETMLISVGDPNLIPLSLLLIK
jgi:hypothetical protein